MMPYGSESKIVKIMEAESKIVITAAAMRQEKIYIRAYGQEHYIVNLEFHCE